MILPPNSSQQLVDPDTGKPTSFFTKLLSDLAASSSNKSSVPWNPGAISALGTTTVVVPVPNAAIGDAATASFSPQPVAGVFPIAQVTSVGAVTVGLFNSTGGTLTPAAGTITAFAWTP